MNTESLIQTMIIVFGVLVSALVVVIIVYAIFAIWCFIEDIRTSRAIRKIKYEHTNQTYEPRNYECTGHRLR